MKKSTKWVRFSILWITVAALMAVIAVLACGPASPTQQSGGGSPVVSKEDPTETPTATRDPECYEAQHPTDPNHVDLVCPEPGPRNVEHNLRSQYNNHMAEKATRQARGESMGLVESKVRVEVATDDALDAVADFLAENNGDRRVKRYENRFSSEGGRLIGFVNIELLPAIAEMDGVEEIALVEIAQPSSPSEKQGCRGVGVRWFER